MSAAMSGAVTLVRWRSADVFSGYEYRDKTREPTPEQKRLWGCEEYRAMPVAEYDALVRERDAAVALLGEALDWIERFPQIGHRFNVERARALSTTMPQAGTSVGRGGAAIATPTGSTPVKAPPPKFASVSEVVVNCPTCHGVREYRNTVHWGNCCSMDPKDSCRYVTCWRDDFHGGA